MTAQTESPPLYSLLRQYGPAIATGIVAVLLMIHPSAVLDWFALPLWRFTLTTIGTMLGVGLGLGLATHVHESLQAMEERQRRIREGTNHVVRGFRKTPMGISSANSRTKSVWDTDETLYTSLMSSAGYDVATDRLLRGQVVRPTSKFFQKAYPFTETFSPQDFRSVKVLREQWPTLPERVTLEIGRFVEHIMRDFVSSWYSYIDSGCQYTDERKKRQERADRVKHMEENNIKEEPQVFDPRQRTMVFSTALHRPIPMLNSIYHALAVVFGNLSTRVEGVNVFSLLLIKWIKVLSQTFRVYRQLRKEALLKSPPPVTAMGAGGAAGEPKRGLLRKASRGGRRTSSNNNNNNNNNVAGTTTTTTAASGSSSSSLHDGSKHGAPGQDNISSDNLSDHNDNSNNSNSNDPATAADNNDMDGPAQMPKPAKLLPVSEMAVTREFLAKGKLHQAVTFGMDIPSILFADTEGKECGIGQDRKDDETPLEMTEDQVLEARLFDTRVLNECELDYNRVLGHRLIRALLPRTEFSSSIVRTMLTEMMAGCVLGPLMGCFCPEYVNAWILMACDQGETKGSDDKDGADKEEGNPSLENDQDKNAGAADKSHDGKANGDHDNEYTDADAESEIGHEVSLEADNSRDLAGTTLPTKSNDELGASFSSVSPTPVKGLVKNESNSDFFSSTNNVVNLDDDDDDNDNDTKHNMDALDISASIDEDSPLNDNNGTDGNDHAAGVEDDNADDEEDEEDTPDEPLPTGDFTLTLLTMSLIELQRFMDFEECRAEQNNQDKLDINWSDQVCQDAISQLVLVIESALVHGRRKEKLALPTSTDTTADNKAAQVAEETGDGGVEVSISSLSGSGGNQGRQATLVDVLMEMTGDIDSFEDKLMDQEEALAETMTKKKERCAHTKADILKSTPNELKTLRSLIAAWLHTGQAHRIISVLLTAQNSVLLPYYYNHAFLRTPENAGGFVRQLRSLNGVTVLVDTVSVLSATSMDINEDGVTVVPKPAPPPEPTPEQSTPDEGKDKLEDSSRHGRRGRLRNLIKKPSNTNMASLSDEAEARAALKTVALPSAYTQPTGTPRFLDFRRNENFASSLRSERDRRLESWKSSTADDGGLRIICRLKGSTDKEVALHRELHQIARIFYAGTNMVAIRNGARRKDSGSGSGSAGGGNKPEDEQVIPLSLLTVEMASARRRIEVPDDDSSFLLRAQPRPLNAVGVHRDPRNHDNSFKSFAATFEEPAVRPGSNRYSGGKYLRRCMLKYYPNDRTASVNLTRDIRKLDQRKGKHGAKDSTGLADTPAALSGDFLGQRNLCQKWVQKGATPRSGSILSSSVMETQDFNAVPRSGKAIDFVYKSSLFERPMVELAGKRFMVNDSSITGTHRADGSSLEMSDAALSVALLQVGNDWQMSESEAVFQPEEGIHGDSVPALHGEDAEDIATSSAQRRKLLRRSSVEMGSDGYPIVWMKYTRKQGDKNVTEVRSYRASFIRAALMLTAARLDAQQQCLVKCVRAGSARSATKQRTEAFLQPTAKLLEYANSGQREKQSILLRDLKLGINHIDREQLRRNGLLSPRHPTQIRDLQVIVEDAAKAKDTGVMQAAKTLFRIRCIALVSTDQADVEDDELETYRDEDGTVPYLVREEWVIYRSYNDFQTLHKHLKGQVAPSEQSASAGARLVGAATAAFTVGGTAGGSRRRKGLIPSLGQASKATTIGVGSKKFLQKRMAVLNGYLQYLIAPNHLLNRSVEILIFLGAFYPLPQEVRTGGDIVNNKTDILGRALMARMVHTKTIASVDGAITGGSETDGTNGPGQLQPPQQQLLQQPHQILLQQQPQQHQQRSTSTGQVSPASPQGTLSGHLPSSSSLLPQQMPAPTPMSGRSVSTPSAGTAGTVPSGRDPSLTAEATEDDDQTSGGKSRVKEIDMIPSIKAKIDEVPLSQVRGAFFELVRYQFDFDNASFFRNRMFSALKTMSFAVASSGEFRKMLYESHIEYVNPTAIGEWIELGLDTLFPDGVFMQSSPPLTAQEKKDLSEKLKAELPKAFPDQIRSVLGTEIVNGGMEILHEMLQNRVVLKSMIYMMFDMLWLEAFPELNDFLTGAAALDAE